MMLPYEIREMVALADKLLAAEVPGIVATLFGAQGSSYRRLGSMMVCGLSAEMKCGGVSGGCLEDYIVRRGHEILRQQDAALLSFSADPLAAHDDIPTLGCGGFIEVLIERLRPSHLPYFRHLDSAAYASIPSVVALQVESNDNRVLNVQRTIRNDDPQLAAAKQRALEQRQSVSVTLQENPQHVTRRMLLQYIPPLRRLIVCGAGNDAMPLCSLAKMMGWHVTIVDRRTRLATMARFPGADLVLAEDWASNMKRLSWSDYTAVVVMTHSFEDDLEIMPLLAEQKIPYLGLLGPIQRRERLLRILEHDALLPESLLQNLHSPVGLDLGERSAPGIALSIMGEIVSVFNDRSSAETGVASLSAAQSAYAHA